LGYLALGGIERRRRDMRRRRLLDLWAGIQVVGHIEAGGGRPKRT
jgi:hypothetical protein